METNQPCFREGNPSSLLEGTLSYTENARTYSLRDKTTPHRTKGQIMWHLSLILINQVTTW